MKEEVKTLAKKHNIKPAILQAFVSVESGGQGFIRDRLVIQFEPAWFKRYAKKQYDELLASGVKDKALRDAWEPILGNTVGSQDEEYRAFSKAFRINKEAAMLSTSIGAPQIMGFHYAMLGYVSVDEMWDDFKSGIYAQLDALCRYIKIDKKLKEALDKRDWSKVAELYNGKYYKEFAEKKGTQPYDVKLRNAYYKATNELRAENRAEKRDLKLEG